MRPNILFSSLFLLLTTVLPSHAAVTALRCGRLLDPASGRVTQNAVVLVNGDRIERVGPAVEIPEGSQVIDLSRSTCLPGLIDSHTHVLLQPENAAHEPIRTREDGLAELRAG